MQMQSVAFALCFVLEVENGLEVFAEQSVKTHVWVKL